MLIATVVSAPCTMSQWLTVLPGVIQTAAYSECDGLETLGNPHTGSLHPLLRTLQRSQCRENKLLSVHAFLSSLLHWFSTNIDQIIGPGLDAGDKTVTYTVTHSHTHRVTHTVKYTQSHTVIHTQVTHIQSNTHSHIHTVTHTVTYTQSHTHSHTHIVTHIVTHMQSLTQSHTQYPWRPEEDIRSPESGVTGHSVVRDCAFISSLPRPE